MKSVKNNFVIYFFAVEDCLKNFLFFSFKLKLLVYVIHCTKMCFSVQIVSLKMKRAMYRHRFSSV